MKCFLFLGWLAIPLGVFAQHYREDEIARFTTEAARVTIIRDNWGIPHIYGKTDEDCVFGLMYAECETDFARVEKNYLEVMGRQAEAYGNGYLTNDLELQLIEDTADAIRDYRRSPPWLSRLLDAFADGVNYYLYKHPDVQPLVLKRFLPWFPLMFTDGSVSATSTGGISAREVHDFYMKGTPVAMEEAPARGAEAIEVARGAAVAVGGAEAAVGDAEAGVLPRGAEAVAAGGEETAVAVPETGSNGLAVAPARTAGGHALLYINPHVPFYFRMEAQMVSQEGLNVYGAVTWGQFFVYQGFNAHCGWMHTSSYADVSDLYIEDVKQDNGQWMYRYDGQWKPVRTRTLVLQGQTITAYYTGHGPVMGERNGHWLSLKEYNRSMNALMEAWLITRARNLTEYRAAMNFRANTTNNTVYADDLGNIAYWHGNFMPRRDPGLDWSQPVDGTTSATEWGDPASPDSLVHVYNPASGWIQNCNSTPYTVSGSSSPLPSAYPTYMAPDGQNYRSVHAMRFLERAHGWTLDSLIGNGYDTYMSAFEVLLPALFKAAVPDSLREAVALLKAWDLRASDTSIATTLAMEWGYRMLRNAPRARTIEESSNAVATVTAVAAASDQTGPLLEVIRDLTRKFGTWRVPWGDLNRYQRLTGKIVETYDDKQPSLSVGLGSSTFGCLPSFASRYMTGTQKRYGVSGNSFIAAVEFGPKIVARTIVTGGESSDPASPHFTDQAPGYIHGQFKDVLFYKEDVQAHAERTYHPGE